MEQVKQVLNRRLFYLQNSLHSRHHTPKGSLKLNTVQLATVNSFVHCIFMPQFL